VAPGDDQGEDFTGATAVSFGGAQVAFHFDSDTQITRK
jgi:hypothetical protein